MGTEKKQFKTSTHFVGSVLEGGTPTKWSFHLVTHFEECSPDVTVNCELHLLETFGKSYM